MNRASENIHVSQASISSAITQLEDQFNLQLFVRHHAQGMSLTSSGKTFFAEAKSLLQQAESLQSHAADLANKVLGNIEIACFGPLAPTITPELCHEFISRHPDVQVNVREGNQAEILGLLQEGSIDLALTYDMQLPAEIDFIALASLEPYVLLGKSHPLSNHKSLSLEDLAQEKLILLDLPLSSDYFLSLFKRADVKPVIHARTKQTDVMRGLIARGYGYGLANVRPINKLSLDGSPLSYVRLSGEHQPLILGIALLKNRMRTSAINAFIDYAQQNVTDTKIPGMVEKI